MDQTLIEDLPFFDRFNTVAANDELFDEVVRGNAENELPSDDIFIVSHRMTRDIPYGAKDYYELTYVLEGSAVDLVEGQELHLLADSLYLTTPAAAHGLHASNPDTVVVVICLRTSLFESGVFAEYLASENPVAQVMRGEGPSEFMVFSDSYGRVLFRSVRTLLKEYKHAGQRANFAVCARTLLLLAQLTEINTYSFYGLDKRMMDVVTYARAHCSEASVSSLAAHFGYSETYFSTLVRRRCGVTARELIVAARLRRARELLLTTNMAVHDIATAVGYESYSHFNRIFRRTYAITPAAYRAFAARDLNA